MWFGFQVHLGSVCSSLVCCASRTCSSTWFDPLCLNLFPLFFFLFFIALVILMKLKCLWKASRMKLNARLPQSYTLSLMRLAIGKLEGESEAEGGCSSLNLLWGGQVFVRSSSCALWVDTVPMSSSPHLRARDLSHRVALFRGRMLWPSVFFSQVVDAGDFSWNSWCCFLVRWSVLTLQLFSLMGFLGGIQWRFQVSSYIWSVEQRLDYISWSLQVF